MGKKIMCGILLMALSSMYSCDTEDHSSAVAIECVLNINLIDTLGNSMLDSMSGYKVDPSDFYYSYLYPSGPTDYGVRGGGSDFIVWKNNNKKSIYYSPNTPYLKTLVRPWVSDSIPSNGLQEKSGKIGLVLCYRHTIIDTFNVSFISSSPSYLSGWFVLDSIEYKGVKQSANYPLTISCN